MSGDSNLEDKTTKVILVTGGLGYLGSQLLRDLAQISNPASLIIRTIDNFYSGQHEALMNLPENAVYQFIEGDILDPVILRAALINVDIVVHLAALVHTPMSFERATWVDQVNHWGTVQLIEACLDAGVPRLIFASTTAVYGPGIGLLETDSCRPQGAYAQSKRRAEQAVISAIARGLNPTIIRFGMFYGLASVTRFHSFINRFSFLTGIGQPLTIFGDGKQTRSIIHVNDASNALLFAIKYPELTSRQILNALDRNISVLETVQFIEEILPRTQIRYTEQDIRTHLSFEADNKAFVNLGWQTTVPVKQGISELIDQFRSLSSFNLPQVEWD